MIPTYQRILVAHDLTSNADNAFRHAVQLARCSDATVYLVHIVPKIDPFLRKYVGGEMGDEQALEKFERRSEEEALADMRRDLEDFARSELQDHPEEIRRLEHIEVRIDDPAVGILRAADEHDVDLIVMGTHSKGLLEQAFLGSVAEKVLRQSRRPVFVVPINE